jgi:hypothetical protein
MGKKETPATYSFTGVYELQNTGVPTFLAFYDAAVRTSLMAVKYFPKR